MKTGKRVIDLVLFSVMKVLRKRQRKVIVRGTFFLIASQKFSWSSSLLEFEQFMRKKLLEAPPTIFARFGRFFR
jgi:hypothetical protein